MHRLTWPGFVAPLTIGLCLAPGVARSQSLWLERDHVTTIRAEAHHVDVENTNEKLLTGVAFLDVRHELSPKASIVGELPYARYETSGEEFLPEGLSESSIGNPYLGVEITGSDSPFFGEIGVRAPVMSDQDIAAEFTGLFSDLSRAFAFFPNTVPISAILNLRTPSDSEIRARLRFGPTLTIPTESGPDTELYGVYAWQIGYEGRSVRVGSALSGWVLLTEDFGNLGSRTLTQFEFHADFGAARVRPGAEFRVPLGAAASFTSSVVGLSLSFFP